jgi:hypothetical protein
MSLADNKRSVFTTIGSYNSLMEQGKAPRQTDLFPSINNKDDIVPFLLDVLKTVAGSDALIETIGGMFGKLVDEVEPKLKTALTKQFIQPNASETLPTSFKTNGITVPVKTIDINGKLKVNPNTTGGALIYDTSIPSFDKRAYDAILNSGIPQGFNNISINYIASTDSFQIKPSGSTTNIGAFFTTYIENTELINKKELVSNVMDNFYGTLAKNQNKTVEQTYNELQVETLLQQLLDDDDSFVISPDKYDELLSKAREMVEGVISYDLGCGLMPSELDFDNFSTTVSTISGSTDPFFIGNQLGATIDQSTSGTTTTEDLTSENKQTIKDGFFQRIIRIFTVKLLQAVTTAPQVRALFGMMSSLQNNGVVKIDNATQDLKYFKTCIKCMAKEIMKLIAEFIFALAIAYLIKLLKPVIKKVVKEKINQYVGVISSLTGALGKVTNVIT